MVNDLLAALGKRFPLTPIPAGDFAVIKASGMTFETRAYKAEGLGHVSVMTASGMLGLMKMDTLIVNPFEIDLPLYSYDRIHALGNDTLIIELYDTLLGHPDLSLVAEMKERFADLPDHALGEHWYDAIKLPESVSKKGKKDRTPRFDALTKAHFAAYLAVDAAPCDPEEKRKKAKAYTDGLLTHGGPSTDSFIKSIGREKTETLFRTVLFGV